MTSKGSELYRKTDNVSQLLDSLRDAYIAYKDTAGRCKIGMEARSLNAAAESLGCPPQKAGADEQRLFYLAPNVIQLEEPEKQKRFRKEYISEVGARPDAEPLTLIADTLHLEALSVVADRSKPSATREELAVFFKRHAVGLQHKKYKMLGRWAN